MLWQTSKRKISLDRPLVMGILNTTPDSFSDGGMFASVDAALQHAEEMIKDGVSIIDIGGESTRPGSSRVSADEECSRVIPIIQSLTDRFDVPISIDTSKAAVAAAAVEAGAEIINDISGLRWDEGIGDVAAEHGAGLILMHSRGDFESMHSLEPVADIVSAVTDDLQRSMLTAADHGVSEKQMAVDIGLGFGKTFEQNLELLGELGSVVSRFTNVPVVVGASRKSFLGKVIDEPDATKRGAASIAAAVIAAMNGALILRVHDVKATLDALQLFISVRDQTNQKSSGVSSRK